MGNSIIPLPIIDDHVWCVKNKTDREKQQHSNSQNFVQVHRKTKLNLKLAYFSFQKTSQLPCPT